MAREKTISFTTASVTAASSLNHNQTGLPNKFNIVRLKITPNTAGGAARAEIYEKDTFASDDLCYVTQPFSSALIDPIQINTGVERNQFWTAFYEDLDATLPSNGELHLKIYNDDTANKTYAVEVDIEELTVVAYKTVDESVSNNILQDDNHLSVNVQASQKYKFRAVLFWTAAGGTPGIKVAIGGTHTVTNMKAQITLIDDSANTILTTARVTALASAVGADDTGDNVVIVEGFVEVNAAGTLLITWAQNTTDAVNATTVQRDSFLELIPAG